MTQKEAIKIVLDVALKRAPHNRHEIREASLILDSPTLARPGRTTSEKSSGNLD